MSDSNRRLTLVCLCLISVSCQRDTSSVSGAQADAATNETQGSTETVPVHTNLLINETSPYLLQHAHNPVNWHPWGPAAFEKAKKEDKPVFLSVGYSTCYWCHVMERESFEKQDVADILNKHFIAIKVDREERPDVDEQYMTATQIMSGRGGWPNSVWLTPDGKPWMAGTYFPRERFKSILEQLADFWKDERDKVNQQADQLSAAIRRSGSGGVIALRAAVNQELVDQAIAEITESFDPKNGGFGSSPKFPPHGQLRLLTHEYRRTKDESLLKIIRQTLDGMLAGGIRDHLGGGFHRYSTDAHWLVPHFEKMLYDNAQLMRAFTDGYLLTGDERCRDVVADIFDWLQREMTNPRGAFYSAVDSESQQEEGRFYVWRRDEVMDVLGADDGELFAAVYGVEPQGNFTEEATGERPGTNIIYLPQPIDDVAAERKLDAQKLRDRLADMRARLLDVRNQREFPHLDDKVLAGWNALMIDSLAYAGRQLKEPRYTDAATAAATFILDKMTRDGHLLRTYRAEQAKQPAFLDDYAFLIAALIEIHEATGEERWLSEARQFTDVMLSDFQDQKNGGFYFSTEEHSDILIRSKNLLGGGNIPSGNGVAAQALIRLDAIQGNADFSGAARRTLESLSGLMGRAPSASDSLILAVAEGLQTGLFRDDSAPANANSADAAASELTRAQAVARAEASAVVGELFASTQTVRPGQEFQVAVVATIDKGWHLYGPNPNADFLIESKVELSETESAVIVKQQLPAGTRKRDQTVEKELLLYEGQVTFLLTIRIGDDAAAGDTRLDFKLTTQACDDERCLPPEETRLSLPLKVGESGR